MILALSAIPVERDSITSPEKAVFETFNRLSDGWNLFFTPIMQLGGFLAVPLLAIAAAALRRSRRIGVDLLLGGTIAWLLARLVKDAFARGRPAEFFSEVIIRGDPVIGYGYISGHTAVAVALATIAAAYLGWRGKMFVIVLAAIVGLARIYVGAHLPLDVAGGAAMGWAVGSLVHLVLLPEVLGENPEEEI